jgi:hypothetical protein
MTLYGPKWASTRSPPGKSINISMYIFSLKWFTATSGLDAKLGKRLPSERPF